MFSYAELFWDLLTNQFNVRLSVAPAFRQTGLSKHACKEEVMGLVLLTYVINELGAELSSQSQNFLQSAYFFRVLKQMWKKGAVNDEGYFKLTSAYSQELLLTATSAKLLEIKGKTLSTFTGKKIYKKNKCLHQGPSITRQL